MHIKNIFCVAMLCVLSVHAAPPTLPPLPRGVTDLKFGQFFVMPVGPQGLTFTDKLLSLEGKRVRMAGYMVEQEKGIPGVFLFSPLPVQLHDHDSALADDLPATVAHVSVPTCRDRQVPYAPGLMLLTGTLSVGPRDEADGRISLVRLALDPPSAFSAARRTPPAPKTFHRLSSTKPTEKQK